MSVEQAIHEHWTGYQPLAALVPAKRVYTGLSPLRDSAGQTVAFPYVSLAVQGEAEFTRTSSGTLFTTERIRFSIFTKDYEAGQQIAQAISDYFNRRDFAWSRGRVLDMKPADRTETEDPDDGVWRIARDFHIRYSIT